MDLSIIIVNWNSKEFLRKCIRTIPAATKGIDYEIVVIDSASFDGCGEMLGAEFPSVKFIQSEKNVGFARANNMAFEKSCGKMVLFLNPDTEVKESAIAVLLDAMKDTGVGIAGPRLLNTDGSLQTSAVQSFPTILNQALDAEPLRKAFPTWPMWGIAALYAGDASPFRAEALSGACLMMRREVFDKVGRFSEDYFMYAEDLDLCYKVHRSGLKNLHVPAAVVLHHGGGSTDQGRSSFSEVMMRESVYRFLVKIRGHFYGTGFRISMAVCALFRLLILLLMLPINYCRGRSGRVLVALRKWSAILKWTLGMQRWVAKYS